MKGKNDMFYKKANKIQGGEWKKGALTLAKQGAKTSKPLNGVALQKIPIHLTVRIYKLPWVEVLDMDMDIY